MEYTVIENYSDIRYTARLEFTESIYNYLVNGMFRFIITDLLLETVIEITDYNTLIGDYSLTAPIRVPPLGKTTSECQLDDSLVKNKGIVIELVNEKTIIITMIPRCSDSEDNKIGFYASSIKFYANIDGGTAVNIDITAKLYPRVTRSDTFELKVPGTEDPILPNDVKRPGYTFPARFPVGKEKVTYDFNYNTDTSLYVNTCTSDTPSDGEVPLYISTLSACFITEGTDRYIPDWDNAESYLYDNNYEPGRVKIDIDYIKDDEPTLIDNLVVVETVVNNETKQYTTSLINYEITQLIYKNVNYPFGKYQNALFFGLRAIHDEPVE